MTIDNGLGVAGHELDEAVIDTAKKALRGTAEPLLKSLFATKAKAERNIKKRQEWLDGLVATVQAVRDAYDAGDASGIKAVQEQLAKYEASLLRATKSSGNR